MVAICMGVSRFAPSCFEGQECNATARMIGTQMRVRYALPVEPKPPPPRTVSDKLCQDKEPGQRVQTTTLASISSSRTYSDFSDFRRLDPLQDQLGYAVSFGHYQTATPKRVGQSLEEVGPSDPGSFHCTDLRSPCHSG